MTGFVDSGADITKHISNINFNHHKEVDMAVKVIIKRHVPEGKSREMIPLFRKMRSLAMNQKGYIAGETLRNMNDPEDFIVISNWQSSEDWVKWLKSSERQGIQGQIDNLLGGQTQYEIYHYGFTE
ncbi:MAG: antibiotic biosynthesis monooxygenase [Novosphingobium sp.]